jgi:hypothetical protein
MLVIPTDGNFQVVEPNPTGDGLRYLPVAAWETASPEAKWVSPITVPAIGDFAPPHPDRLSKEAMDFLFHRMGVSVPARQLLSNALPNIGRVVAALICNVGNKLC